MLTSLLASRLAVRPDLPTIILVFFAYALVGYCLEVVVLTIEKRRLVVDRGFTAHLPFCIIYGFGAMGLYGFLSPFKDQWLVLFIVGAIGATAFEYLVGQLQIRMFGDFWWDYSKKPFNYKGILCLESTIGWGIGVLFVVKFLHGAIVRVVSMIPAQIAMALAILLVMAYITDFAWSARIASRRKAEAQAAEAARAEELEKRSGGMFSKDM